VQPCPVTDQASNLAKGCRKRVDDIDGWVKPLGQPVIAAPRSVQFVSFPFKYGEDSFRRIAAFYLSREWVGSKVLPGLLLYSSRALSKIG
jgi:hypothetical protein